MPSSLSMKRAKNDSQQKKLKDGTAFPEYKPVGEKSIETMFVEIKNQMEANHEIMETKYKKILEEIESVGSVIDVIVQDKTSLTSDITNVSKQIANLDKNVKADIGPLKGKLNDWFKVATEMKDQTIHQQNRMDRDLEILEKGIKYHNERAVEETTLTGHVQKVNLMAGDLTRIDERTTTMLSRLDEMVQHLVFSSGFWYFR